MTDDDKICRTFSSLGDLMHQLAASYEAINDDSIDAVDAVRCDAMAWLCRALACREAPSVIDVLHQAAHDGLTPLEIIDVHTHGIAILMAHLQESMVGVEQMNDADYLKRHYGEMFKVLEFYRIQAVKRALASGGELAMADPPTESVH